MLANKSDGLRTGLSQSPVEIGLYLLFVLALLAQLLPSSILPGQAPLLAEEGVVLAAPHITVAPGETVLMLLRVASNGLFFVLMLQAAAQPARRERLLELLALTVFGYALYAVAALHLGDRILIFEKWAYEGSATGTFVNRNSFATFLAFGAVICCALVLKSVRREGDEEGPRSIDDHIRTAFLAFQLLVILATVVATRSRMGLVVTGIGLVAVLFLSQTRNRNSLGYLLIASLGLIIVLLSALALFGNGLLERFELLEQSAETRSNLYHQVVELIGLRRLTGFGGGSFQIVYPLVHRLPVGLDVVWDKTHNTYLALWVELGVVAGRFHWCYSAPSL